MDTAIEYWFNGFDESEFDPEGLAWLKAHGVSLDDLIRAVFDDYWTGMEVDDTTFIDTITNLADTDDVTRLVNIAWVFRKIIMNRLDPYMREVFTNERSNLQTNNDLSRWEIDILNRDIIVRLFIMN